MKSAHSVLISYGKMAAGDTRLDQVPFEHVTFDYQDGTKRHFSRAELVKEINDLEKSGKNVPPEYREAIETLSRQ